MHKIKSILIFLIMILLVYTRLVGLDWGLPYAMHPDERNMVNAVLQLKCETQDPVANFVLLQGCFNPNFFAYGQFPLYLSYLIVYLFSLFNGNLLEQTGFELVTYVLRLISATATIFNARVLLKLIKLLVQDKAKSFQLEVVSLLLFIFSPFFIQFSHFGTTESILMLLYSVIIYLTLKYWLNNLAATSFYVLTAITAGVAIATKVSSLFFLLIPLAVIFDKSTGNIIKKGLIVSYLLSLTLIFSIFFSPHNFISFPQFLGSMGYESDVALGTYRAFYTRQFEYAFPFIFQFTHVFPYALGWPVFIFSVLGFIFLPLKKEFNILRLAILAGFIPNAIMYAKWTRFISPILPLMLVFAVVFLFDVIPMKMGIYKIKKLFRIPTLIGMTILMSIPGIAYLSIYQNQDIRFTVSEWIYKNIPDESYVLSETANVIDVPIPNPKIKNNETMKQSVNINYISFDFYHLDENPDFPSQLEEHLRQAQYIFISSRRVFANHYCPSSDIRVIAEKELNFSLIKEAEEKCQFVRTKYPKVNEYYDRLFSGELGFVKIADFAEFPKIKLLGMTLLELNDEEAEETWTVFDHPVFRIYKKT